MCGFWGRFYYGDPFWGMPWMMIFGSILWLLVIILVLYGIWHFLKSQRKNDKEEILNTLKRRLANGEISQEEFDKIRKVLDL